MENLKKYNLVFNECFHTTDDKLYNLYYQSIQEWDSVGHMSLITLLEDKFEIMLDTDDIINFSSYTKGKEILKKYNVNI